MVRPRFALFVTVGYVALLTYLLLTPEPLQFLFGSAAGEIHGAVDSTVSTYVQHTLAYAVLAALLFWTTSVCGGAPMRASVLLGGSHALLTEGLQRFVPRRHGDLWDLASDAAGIAIVLASAGIAMGVQRVFVQEALRTESAPTDS
jgi:VanZ family protein